MGDCISGTFTDATGTLNARMDQMKAAAKMVCFLSSCTILISAILIIILIIIIIIIIILFI